MNKSYLLTLVLLLMVTPCFGQKIYIDYDKDAINNDYKTFTWVISEETSVIDSSPLMHSRIVNAIEHHLSQGGMIEVRENPDVYVTYHTNEKEEMQLHTDTFGYGAGAGMRWHGGYGGAMGASSTTRTYTYTKGTLIIDIWDAKSEKLVWRGSATATVKEKPEAAAKQIQNVVNKMVKKWTNMKKKMK